MVVQMKDPMDLLPKKILKPQKITMLLFRQTNSDYLFAS